MMKLHLQNFKDAWDHQRLSDWFHCEFPDACHGRSMEEIVVYLDSVTAQARALGLGRLDHVQRLITYELGCGVRGLTDPANQDRSTCHRRIHQRGLDAQLRIDWAERYLFGAEDGHG